MRTSLALLVALLVPLVNACAPLQTVHPQARGTITNILPLQTFSRQSIDEKNKFGALSGTAECDVEVVQLLYRSKYPPLAMLTALAP